METDRFKYLIKELDRLVSIFVRKRDKDKWCITFWTTWCKNKVEHNCHFIWRAYYSHRRDERNLAGGCSSCNVYHQEEHKIIYFQKMVSMYWIDVVNEMIWSRNKIKPDVEWMKEKIQYYRNLNKEK